MSSISADNLQIALITLTIVWITIFTPISLYYARQLWILKQQNIIHITKRHPKVVLLSIILFNTWPTIIRPLTNFLQLYYPGVWATMLANTISYFVGLLCVRFWLLFYDYTYELHSLSLKWKAKISDDLHIPWTIRYKWLGNAKIIVAIPLIVSSCIIILIGYFMLSLYTFLARTHSLSSLLTHYRIFRETLGRYTVNITQPFGAMYIVFIIVIAFKIRTCRDEFYILS